MEPSEIGWNTSPMSNMKRDEARHSKVGNGMNRCVPEAGTCQRVGLHLG